MGLRKLGRESKVTDIFCSVLIMLSSQVTSGKRMTSPWTVLETKTLFDLEKEEIMKPFF